MPQFYDLSSTTITLGSTTYNASSTWDTWSSTLISSVSATSLTATWITWSAASHVFTSYTETPAQRAELARQRAAVNEQRREAAIVRADKLLHSILTEVQRAHVEAHGFFIVRGRSGQLYRIRRGWSANVDVLAPDGQVQHRLCAHPGEYCPEGDNMAAQKLMLESADEELFLRIANKHSVYAPARVAPEILQAMAP